MKEPRTRKPVESRLANGLLVHGQRLTDGEIGIEDFWKVTEIGRSSGQAWLKKLEVGSYLCHERPRRFGPGFGHVVGISLGAESLRGGLVDANGSVHCSREAKPVRDRLSSSPDSVVRAIKELCLAILSEALSRDEFLVKRGVGRRQEGVLPLLGVAVAWPTPIHRVTKQPKGRALKGRRWGKSPLPELVADELNIDVTRSHALNDANAVALAVAFSETRRVPRLRGEGQVALAIRLGGGIGAGTALIDKYDTKRSAFLGTRVVEGDSGYAGELGHLRIRKKDINSLNKRLPEGLVGLSPAWRCSCGDTQHLEALASASALARRIEESDPEVQRDVGLAPGRTRAEKSRMREVIAAWQDDSRGERALKDVGRLVGEALASPILMLNPLTITITGSLALSPVQAGIEERRKSWYSNYDSNEAAMTGPDPEIQLLTGDDNDYAAVRGAALVVLREEIFRRFDDLTSINNAGRMGQLAPSFTTADLDRMSGPNDGGVRWGTKAAT